MENSTRLAEIGGSGVNKEVSALQSVATGAPHSWNWFLMGVVVTYTDANVPATPVTLIPPPGAISFRPATPSTASNRTLMRSFSEGVAPTWVPP